MLACKNSGMNVLSDFTEFSKFVEVGATSKPLKDYELSRFRDRVDIKHEKSGGD